MRAMAASVYQSFVNKVAEGRGLTMRQVSRAAEGQVWTGEQAVALGLVDGLGGFDEAARRACAAAGLADAHAAGAVDLIEMKKPMSTGSSALLALASVGGVVAGALAAWLVRGGTTTPLADVHMADGTPLLLCEAPPLRVRG